MAPLRLAWPWVVGAMVMGWLVALRWLAPPAALPSTAPHDAFSGERAVAVLERVLGDERPHPVGTPANRAVEQRILAELVAVGASGLVERGEICAEHCAEVRNIVVELPGTDPSLAPVLVSTHYDSVNSGPGAGDAGAAVATSLELARLLTAYPLNRTVQLLFNEGEEAGMLGAQVYLRSERNIAAVVNLEARGTGGNAFLFELHGASLPWVRRYAQHAAAPSVSSLYTAIYAMLPNNTDATIFGQHGLPVANVAFLGGGVRYHTPADDLAHLDPGSVQHLGEQALGLLRGLDSGDLDELRGHEAAVFWDVGFCVFVFPVLVFQVFVVVLFLTSWGSGLVRARSVGPLRVGAALGLLLLFPALAAVIGFLLESVAELAGVSWLGVPVVALLLLLSSVIVLALAFSRSLSRVGERALWIASTWIYAGVALGLAWLLPEGAYLFAQPALLLLLGMLLPERVAWARVGLAFLAMLPVLHLSAGLVPALGLSGPLVTATFATGLLPMLPLLQGVPALVARRAIGLPVVLLLLSLALPSSTRDRPTGILATHLTLDGQAWLYSTPARFPRATEASPWEGPPVQGPMRLGHYVTAATPAPLPPPRLQILERVGPRLRVRVHAPGALGLYVVGGRPSRGEASDDPFHWLGEAHGLELEVDRGPLWIAAIHPGLPESVAPLPEGTVPIHSGLQTWVATSIVLQ